MRAARVKKCKVCKADFKPYQTMQKVCSPSCAAKFASNETRKQYKREALEYRKRTETKKSQLSKAQAAVNGYIRTRDKGKPCISCEGFKVKSSLHGSILHAGHWHGRGAYPSLRFVLWNIHLQCAHCNEHLGGHVIGYEAGLAKKFGREWVEKRKQQGREWKPNHYSKKDLERIATLFRAKDRLYKRLFRGD
ncbi:recombination protein NinG [uncultured Paraglaciecola sp.]|uniref:recombination protein NinG n=1 Tax=uncultured Paraglaciecola sp. TaxID=1765024 RepID=UPI002627E8EA|nr:recombination protein NinG [uncultured Paraglaciecola sp.]